MNEINNNIQNKNTRAANKEELGVVFANELINYVKTYDNAILKFNMLVNFATWFLETGRDSVRKLSGLGNFGCNVFEESVNFY